VWTLQVNEGFKNYVSITLCLLTKNKHLFTLKKPAYGEAATELTSFVPGAYLAAVDATKATKLSERFKLQGFPTIKYFENGEFKFDYSHGRTKESIVQFMRNPTADASAQTAPTPQNEDKWDDLPGHQHIRFLDDTSFDNFLLEKRKILVLFYA